MPLEQEKVFQGKVRFAEFIPVFYIELGGLLLLLFILAALAYKLRKWYVSSIPPKLVRDIRLLGLGMIIRMFFHLVFVEGFGVYTLYKKYRSRWWTHFAMYYGFFGLMATTTLAYIFNPQALPVSFTNPIRMLGNLSGLMVIVGGAVTFWKYIRDPKTIGTVPNDLVFLVLLYITTITGFMTEAGDYLGHEIAAYGIYAIHLVSVIALLALAPFTRFIHAILTPALILFDRYQQELEKRGLAKDYKRDILVEYLAKLMP